MQWLMPWEAVADLDWAPEKLQAFCEGWERQLSRETGLEHPLSGQGAVLIARHFGTDDALFRLADGRVAEAHLSWGRQPRFETSGPFTGVFPTLDAWARERMLLWHQEWLSLENEPPG